MSSFCVSPNKPCYFRVHLLHMLAQVEVGHLMGKAAVRPIIEMHIVQHPHLPGTSILGPDREITHTTK